MRLTAAWLGEAPLRAALAALGAGGDRVLIVGGAVRNAVLGLPPGDIDLATAARPEAVLQLAAAAGLRAVPTGLAHGTVTVIVHGRPFEVTSFRRDIVTHGRHATVTFGGSLEDDARRRDFTMNALYAEGDGRLLDPLGGLADARAGRVRFILDARTRIREDYLRILRFFRFHAWYGRGAPDPEGLAACAELAAGLEGLSRERIGAELLKLLEAPDPAPALAAFAATGGLERILPGADPGPVARLVGLERTAGASGPQAQPAGTVRGARPGGAAAAPQPPRAAPPSGRHALLRLAALGGAEAPRRLRLSRAQAGWLVQLRAVALGPMGPAEAAWRHGAALARDAALLRAALGGHPLPPSLEAALALGAGAQFPVSARELQPALQGPALGQALARLQRLWIDSGFALDRDALLAALDAPRG